MTKLMFSFFLSLLIILYVRDFNPMGLVGSGGDTRVLDGGDDQSGICLLLFVLDQSQASFENGVWFVFLD